MSRINISHYFDNSINVVSLTITIILNDYHIFHYEHCHLLLAILVGCRGLSCMEHIDVLNIIEIKVWLECGRRDSHVISYVLLVSVFLFFPLMCCRFLNTASQIMLQSFSPIWPNQDISRLHSLLSGSGRSLPLVDRATAAGYNAI